MMLKKLVDIIDNSRCEIKGGTLFCSDWIVTDNQILIDLNKHNCFEQSIFIDDIKINSSVSLELSISELSKITNVYKRSSEVMYKYNVSNHIEKVKNEVAKLLEGDNSGHGL